MDEIVKLNTEGVGDFQSFAQQAKNATGGIATGISGAKTAITRGVAGIIKSLEEGVKDASGVGFGDIFGGISAGIDKAFSFVNDIIGRIFETIEKFSQSEAGQRMADTFNKLKESFGGMDAKPVILTVIETIVNILAGAGAAVLEIVNGIRQGIEKFANSPAGQALHDTFQRIGEQFKSITGGEGPTLLGFLEGLGKVFEGIAQGVGIAVLVIATGIENIIIVVKRIVEFFTTDIPNAFNAFLDFWVSIWASVILSVTTVIDAIVNFFTVTIPETIMGFVDFWIGIWATIIGTVANVVNGIRDFFMVTIPNTFNQVIEFFKGIPQKIVDAMASLGGKLLNWAKQMPGKIIEGFGRIADIGLHLVQGIWNGIQDATAWILDKIKSFGTAVMNGLKAIFGIASPSKKTTEMGMYIAQGLGNGITDGIDYVLDSVGKMGDAVLDAFNDINASIPVIGSDIDSTIDIRHGAFDIGGSIGDPIPTQTVVINQTVEPANSLLAIYNQTRFGVRTAMGVSIA
jgi:phage-related protein